MLTHSGTQQIDTERLVLRRFSPDDAEMMFCNWANDPEVTRYTTWDPHPDAEYTRELLTAWANAYEKRDVYNWCIVWKESGEPIGSISVVGIAELHRSVEIGYCMTRALWGKGIMPEALGAVIDFLFRETNVNRIMAKHDIRNDKSGRVMEKCGMQYEGTMRDVMYTKGEFATGKVYAVLRADIQ